MSQFEANCHFYEEDFIKVTPSSPKVGGAIHIETFSKNLDNTVCIILSDKESEALAMYILQTLGKVPYPEHGAVKC